jgi:transposase
VTWLCLSSFPFFRPESLPQNIEQFLSWTSEFKVKVASSIHLWIDRAGGEANKLLHSLRIKTAQWYFLDHPEIPPDNNLAEGTLRESHHKKKS